MDPDRGGARARRDRQRGALLGLAIGDAMGAAVEFEPAGSFEPVTGFRGGGPHGLDPGMWTDDTSMALALADSISEVGWDLDDQAERYVAWWQRGEYSVVGQCFDIGTTVRGSLSRFVATGDARTCGDRGRLSAGNGSIMRLAPVPIRYLFLLPDGLDELVIRAVESSLPTHAATQCTSACAYLTLVLAELMRGRSREEVLSPDAPFLSGLRAILPLHPEIDAIARGSYRTKGPSEILASGYVVHTLEAALWAFARAGNFREAVLAVVNLGDDADTTGAVCGQLAGACWGESGIPPEWLEGLAGRDRIEGALRGLIGD